MYAHNPQLDQTNDQYTRRCNAEADRYQALADAAEARGDWRDASHYGERAAAHRGTAGMHEAAKANRATGISGC